MTFTLSKKDIFTLFLLTFTLTLLDVYFYYSSDIYTFDDIYTFTTENLHFISENIYIYTYTLCTFTDLVKQNGVQPDRQELCKEVEKRFTPYIGQEFGGVEDAVTFYKIYAIACGFDVRRYTTKKWRGGEIKSKLVVCNREGFAHKKPRKDQDGGLDGENSKRIFRVTRVGCKARIRLYMKNGVLVIDRFHEGHNHELISLQDRQFQKLSRNITDYHKMIIVSNSRLKIGATKTYRICKEQVNGYENIGASLNDFKNFHRDVKCFIHERDGQLFVDHFKEMTETRIGFYFDYDLDDDDGDLRRAIWARRYARDNYKIFGDAVSFDPTYSTNKYSMVFTPFTGVDHHKRSVTFCGALIAREDYESFNWVFSRFLIAMGGKEPEYIITDQDPATIMTSSQKIDDIIWDDELEAAEFDGLWEQIVQDHGVGVNDWFADTYAIRGQWVMAHCRDLRMASIMRTTQRSESENSFFKRWMKEYLRLRIFTSNGEGTENMQVIDEKQIAMSIMWSKFMKSEDSFETKE
ncbi:protein FAR1-RELATED SEQUENCE 5-like [Silene latifolia]|uniref:protein FAR1-RELATED SEQUENCE 5-like n=1 Tax=Silene latifolia TaxID=37657 RepID=UPI003D77222D